MSKGMGTTTLKYRIRIYKYVPLHLLLKRSASSSRDKIISSSVAPKNKSFLLLYNLNCDKNRIKNVRDENKFQFDAILRFFSFLLNHNESFLLDCESHYFLCLIPTAWTTTAASCEEDGEGETSFSQFPFTKSHYDALYESVYSDWACKADW